MPNYTNRMFRCPFYRWSDVMLDGGRVVCESAQIDFPDRDSIDSYVLRHCACDDWNQCSIAQSLLQYYTRPKDGGRNQKP